MCSLCVWLQKSRRHVTRCVRMRHVCRIISYTRKKETRRGIDCVCQHHLSWHNFLSLFLFLLFFLFLQFISADVYVLLRLMGKLSWTIWSIGCCQLDNPLLTRTRTSHTRDLSNQYGVQQSRSQTDRTKNCNFKRLNRPYRFRKKSGKWSRAFIFIRANLVI